LQEDAHFFTGYVANERDRSMKRLGLAFGIFLMVFLGSKQDVAVGAVCASGTTLKGVDVSVYNGTVNWTSVQTSGIAFAFARISDGESLDTNFSDNWAGIKAAGMIRGVYQYFEPGEDPTAQANIVLSGIGTNLQPGDLSPVLDLEVTGGQTAATIAANIQTWVGRIQSATGRVPIIYVAAAFWNSDIASSNFVANPLWVANWGVTCPTLPSPWPNWTFWQYSDAGTNSGITTVVDLDEFNGTINQLVGLPPLKIAQTSSNTVILSWAAVSTNFLLQQTSTMAPTNWANVATVPTLVNGTNQVEVTPSSTNRQSFYRLDYTP
jgi:GH25 family lysozyme M1 (1,4-beta-N-acetylmuramidase)